MRYHILGLILVAGAAMPLAAQPPQPGVERRVDRLEQEMRAVQRRVFPSGRDQFVEPEIEAQGRTSPSGLSGDALSSLVERVGALEAELRAITGQVEEQGNRTRQLEQEVGRLRADLQARLDRIEQQARPSTPPPAEREPPPAAAAPATPPPAGETAQEAYNAAFRLWDARRYAEAQTALEQAATRHAGSPWVSWMRNLQGRAYLDDDKPATAARIFLANYQENPRGERAADSLYFLGQALTRLNRRPEACRVYDELESEYPTMREFIRTRLPQARTDARCAAGGR